MQDIFTPGSPDFYPAVVALSLASAVIIGIGIVLIGPEVFAAIILALPIALFLLTDAVYLLWCVLAVILLLPFATLPIDIGITPTLLEITMAGSLVMAVLHQTRLPSPRIVLSPVGAILLVFIGLMLASFVMGITHSRPSVSSLRRFADLILSLAYFLVIVNLVVEERALLRTYDLFLLLGGAAAFLGIVLYFLPQHISESLLNALGIVGYPRGAVLRFIEDNPNLPMRAIGTSVDPNVFGGMLAFMGGLLLPQIFAPGSWRRLAFMFGLLMAVMMALLLTFSRGSFFGLAAALGVLGVMRERRILWLLCGGAILILVLPQTREYVQHFVEGVQGEDLATQMRFGEYKDALILISRYPWFGVGFTGVPDVDIYLGVSCVYLLITEETGLVGLTVFLAIFGVFFAYTWDKVLVARGRFPRLEAILLGSQTAVMAGLVAGILDHYLFNTDFPHAAALLWITVGFGMSAARIIDQRISAPEFDRVA